MRDYLGANAIFNGSSFIMMFRISRTRFQRMMEDTAALEKPFYSETTSCNCLQVASFEARLLLPLKCLAYGVPPHTFMDYFQMSKTLAAKACIVFDEILHEVYHGEYLRSPTPQDLQKINNLHQVVHGRNGLFGHIDCMHTGWKNCPKGWNGRFDGKEGDPTIVFEGVCDYNLWFWHAAYGFAGTMNDLNILNASPLMSTFLEGKFDEVEQASGVVPFEVGGEEFNKMFITCDGIYPMYARFVKTISHPCGLQQERYTKWQESTRKDIERAFGVLQQCFQYVCTPIQMHSLKLIGKRIRSCIILHNMKVSDRVMDGDVTASYNPAMQVENNGVAASPHMPVNMDVNFPAIGTANLPNVNVALEMAEHWKGLRDREEHLRLQRALVNTF
jgi:hypothetical protein